MREQTRKKESVQDLTTGHKQSLSRMRQRSWKLQRRFGGTSTSPWQESRSREILEEKLFLVSPLELEKWNFMSRSPLDFQDFDKSFLFLLSVLKIFVLNFSFSSRFSRFCKTLSLFLLDFQDLKKKIFFSWYPRFCPLFLIKIRSEVSSPHLHFPP